MARIQEWSGTTGLSFPSTLTTSTSPSPTTPGSTLLVFLMVDGLGSSTLFTVTDSVGNVYTRRGTININGTDQLDVWEAGNNIGGASHTVTAGNLGGTTAAIIVEEWTGLGRISDAFASASDNTGLSSSISVGPTGLPAYTNQAVFLATTASTVTAAFTAASGYSNLNQLNSNNSTLGVQSKLLGDPAAQSGATTFSVPANWLGIVITIPFYYGGTTTSTSSTSASTFSTSSTSSSISSTSSSISTTSISTSTSSTSSSISSTSSSISSTSNSTSSTSASSTSASTSTSSTSSSISSTSFSSTSQSSTSNSSSISSTSSSISSTSSSISSTSASTSSTSFSSTSSSSSVSTTTVPPNVSFSYQDFATISIDSTSSAPTQGTSPLTWQHRIGNGLNRYLVVAPAVEGLTAQGTVTAVTFNGVALTKIRADQGANAGPGYKNETSLWVLANPPVGTYQISVTATLGTTPDLAGAAASYFGVNQSTIVDSSNGATGIGANSQSVLITPVQANCWVVAVANMVVDNSSQTIIRSLDIRRQFRPMSIGVNGAILLSDSGQTVFTPKTMNFFSQVVDGSNFVYAITGMSLAPAIVSGNPLINPFLNANYGSVSVNDGDYFIEYGSEYMIREYKYKNLNNTDIVTFTWKGRSTESTQVSPILIQIYNVTSGTWETLARETRVPADTDFTAVVTQSTNLSNYYDSNNTVTFRSYQQVV